jgi:exopolysaccharide production protein ExoY
MSLEVQFRPDVSALHGSVGFGIQFLSGKTSAGGTSRIGPDVLGRPLFPRPRLATLGPLPIGGVAKRAMDVAVALLALVVLAPLMLMVAACVRLSMGGRVFFAQERIGTDGTRFTCWKFRTMPVDADETLRRHLLADSAAAREWRETRKLRNDPRVNCLGKVLRKSSLDELPQLFNVLRGDMSIVGPRPVVTAELHYYSGHAATCFRARPGLTGMWQVSGRNGVGYAKRVALDRYYARHWSIWLDCWIVLKTIPALLSFDKTS